VRFIIIHPTNAHWESGAVPDQALIDRVETLLADMGSAGVLLSGEGLAATSEGVRLRFADGQRTIIPGPFEGENELPASFSIVRVRSLEEAIEWATREAPLLGTAEIDIRPVHEAWDVGMAPVPPDLSTRRYMILHKATAATEAGASLPAESRKQLASLIDDGAGTGVHLARESMRPSRRGRRYKNAKDGKSFYDGPFVETKEMLGGYVIVSADSLEEACQWVPRYMDAIGAESVDVRELE
jgi:hypothetical protein